MSLPTKLTVSRIVIAFLILFLLLFPWQDIGLSFPSVLLMGRVLVDTKYLIAGFFFVIASVTDYLDGVIARKENSKSDFGATLDAIADKILVNGLLIVLAYHGFISLFIPILIVIRDIFVDSLRIMAANKGLIIKASKWGKAKTACMLAGISLMLFYNLPFEIWGIYLAEVLIDIAAILSVVSAMLYFSDWKSKIKLD